MGTWSAHDHMERMECTPHLLLDQKKPGCAMKSSVAWKIDWTSFNFWIRIIF